MSDDQKFSEEGSDARTGRTDEPEVEGHRSYEPAEAQRASGFASDDEPEVEGHLFTSGSPERIYEADRKINRKIN